MQSRRARAHTVAGLWLLEQALRDAGVEESRFQAIGFSASGRPEFVDGPVFSISHSGELVACALHERGGIGLDIERRRGGISPRLMAMIAPEGRDFFDAWCAREATVKASGRVGLARVRAMTLTDTHARLDGQTWPLKALSLVPGYAACLAVAPPLAEALVAPPACDDLGARLGPDQPVPTIDESQG